MPAGTPLARGRIPDVRPEPVLKARPPSRPKLALGNAAGTLPRSPVVLLLVDFVNPLDFDGAPDLAPAALAAAASTAALKRRLQRRGVPCIYANDNYGAWRSDFRTVLTRCRALPGEAGRIARMLSPRRADLTLLKPRHSCFYATPLELLLTQMHARRLILAGLAADLCVLLSAMDACMRGYRVWIPADCTAAESGQRKQGALDYARRALGCRIAPSVVVRAGRASPRRSPRWGLD
ncbi:MAG: cysteine hydrolase [Burkholderiaceae bacterium]|nr:cysteine hydrolase [Burkholderiaceae bacterium]